MDYVLAIVLGAMVFGQLAIIHQLSSIQKGQCEMTAQGDKIHAVVVSIKSAVERLIARGADNLTGEELAAFETAGTEITTSLDRLDPEVPGGPIDETGGTPA